MSFLKIIFPNIAIALGGAESVTMVKGMAVVKVPGRLPVTLDPQDLPPLQNWTAFNLADAVQAQEQRKGRVT